MELEGLRLPAEVRARYRFERVLGEGAMGVCTARTTRSGTCRWR